jgi:hypothetical protein
MLAYVFWHWPQPNLDRSSYIDHLIDFHRTLAANKSTGFQHSTVFSIHGAPWLDTAAEAFEEWYLLDDSAAMDRLNEAAVSGNCELPHNLVAREAAGGTGGLYRLRDGREALAQARYASWFAKPTGSSYPAFYSGLKDLTANPDVALWGRQMTLGPATEFCLHSHERLELSDSYQRLSLPLTVVWSG